MIFLQMIMYRLGISIIKSFIAHIITLLHGQSLLLEDPRNSKPLMRFCKTFWIPLIDIDPNPLIGWCTTLMVFIAPFSKSELSFTRKTLMIGQNIVSQALAMIIRHFLPFFTWILMMSLPVSISSILHWGCTWMIILFKSNYGNSFVEDVAQI